MLQRNLLYTAVTRPRNSSSSSVPAVPWPPRSAPSAPAAATPPSPTASPQRPRSHRRAAPTPPKWYSDVVSAICRVRFCAVPVSRKRKKKSPSGRRSLVRPGVPSRAAQANPLQELFEYRRRLDEYHTALAVETAGPTVDALITAAPGWSDDELEDDFCARFGAAMTQYAGGALEDHVNPDDFLRAVLSVLDERLHESEESGSGLAAVQRLLAVVAGVLPAPLSESAQDLVAEHLDADVAQQVTRGRTLTGPALWARNSYGTRWAVVAPFTSADGAERWYLWDVDACGYEVVTVHSGFHPSAEAALAAWQQSVGPAAAETALTPADDTETLDALLTGELEDTRLGGEDQAQYAEFLRTRRLGRTVRQTAGRARGRTLARLSADTAAERFSRRLQQLGHHDRPAGHQPDEGPAAASDLAAEMAESWSPREHPSLYPYCSPHKVAAAVLHLRDFYKDDFAAELVAVLPEWIRFLAEHTSMTADQTERCLAYASGELRFPGLLDERGQPNPMAQVTE